MGRRGNPPDNFEIGDRGYRSGTYAAFVKGVFLVKLLAYEASEAQLEAVVTLAEFIETRIQP